MDCTTLNMCNFPWFSSSPRNLKLKYVDFSLFLSPKSLSRRIAFPSLWISARQCGSFFGEDKQTDKAILGAGLTKFIFSFLKNRPNSIIHIQTILGFHT